MKNVIVTAYFDIGRKNYSSLPRTNEQYLEYFKFWARLKNEMVIFTQSEFKESILNIRKSYGLENETVIVVIDDLETINNPIFSSMNSASDSLYFQSIRVLPNATSNNPYYSYLMLLKSWFLCESPKYITNGDFYSWVDFGFNHGNDLYTNSLDFGFYWEPNNVSFNKINVFSLKQYDGKPIFEIVRTLEDYMIGTVIIAPKMALDFLYSAYCECMGNLLSVGLIDDDQLILLMCTLKYPEEFEIKYCDWNEQFLVTTKNFFHLKEKRKNGFIRSLSIKYHRAKRFHFIFRRFKKNNKRLLKKIYG